MSTFSSVTIIIPTLNEEKNIGLLIDTLYDLYPAISIIVSDDGSTDKTQAIVKQKKAVLVDRSKKEIKGISAAIVDALKHVQTKNIIVMDADFQHPPKIVGNIVEQLKKYSLVICARKKVVGRWGPIRHLESKIATILAVFRLQKKIHDPLSGYFGIQSEFFKKIRKDNFELRCFKILFNILKNMNFKKTSIGYVYYDFKMRHDGKSKIKPKHIVYFFKNIFS